MKKLCLLVILSTGCFLNSFAQTVTTDATNGDKKYDNYIGAQLNTLIRQVFNFNSATGSTIVNNYLFTYNINCRKTGWGLRLGLGFNYSSNYSNDGITEATTNNNVLHVRLGIEKAYKLSEKWSAGVGLDGIVNLNNNNATTTVHSTDTVTTATKTINNNYGGGVMGWLRYNITSRISIGTEASFYYTSGKQNNTTDITERVPNVGLPGTQITTTETTAKPTISNGTMTLPVAFYIAVKF